MARSPAKGGALGYGDAQGGPFTDVAFVTSLGTPVPRTPEIDGTALSDTDAVIFLDITDQGEVSYNFFVDLVDAAQYVALKGLETSKAIKWWEVKWPISVAGNAVNATDVFEARVSGVSRSGEVRGMITGQLTLRATGPVTPTAETTT